MDLNAYWKTVVDTIQEGVMLVDTAGTIISVNQAMQDLTGYTREELMGSSCRILNCDLCIRFQQQQKQHWCRLFFEGSFQIRQCHIQQKNGRQLTVVKNGAVLRDSSNEVIGAVETLTDISELLDKEQQIESYKRVLAANDTFHGLVGGSRVMRSQFDLLTNAAHSDAPVILFGESGTGKELAARAIHDISERRKKPLIKVNCAALSHSLLESELFGHVKGAFTGATSSRKGRFEAADKGSIFLDEIGDLALSTQVKLLRVLEEQIIERVGDNRPIPVDVRIISATNKNLEEMVKNGAFREDLFFRIRVIPVHLPPLRERTDDIPLLAETFFQRLQLKYSKKIAGIGTEAMQALCAYHWPGNVRELKSAFEYAFVACQDGLIQPEHLMPNITAASTSKANPAPPKAKEDSKKQELLGTLQKTGGNQSETARLLGISRVTVWNRMKKYGISLESKIEG